MRIAVIGAGLAGVTTAFDLALDGHEVTVFERRAGVAAEADFAPASIAAAGLWLAHAAAGRPDGTEPLPASAVVRAWRRWRPGRRDGAMARLQRMAELTTMGQQRLAQLTETLQLDYEHHRGVVALLRTSRMAQRARAALEAHCALALPLQWLDPGELRAVEPGLSPAFSFVAALHWPGGETANGRQFAQALKAAAQGMGVLFQFQIQVNGIAAAGGAEVELRLAPAHEFGQGAVPSGGTGATTVPAEMEPRFDGVVVCSGSACSALLGRHAGCPPAKVAHQYSVTAPLREPADAVECVGPRGAMLDPDNSVAIVRMGERLRVAGLAASGAAPQRPAPAMLERLYRALDEAYPGAARTAKAQPWVGSLASTPDGLPIVGPSAMRHVWLHWGHGTQAWAWAPATSRLLADQIRGQAPALDPALLDPRRLR